MIRLGSKFPSNSSTLPEGLPTRQRAKDSDREELALKLPQLAQLGLSQKSDYPCQIITKSQEVLNIHLFSRTAERVPSRD